LPEFVGMLSTTFPHAFTWLTSKGKVPFFQLFGDLLQRLTYSSIFGNVALLAAAAASHNVMRLMIR
jgi:hypothetical protein